MKLLKNHITAPLKRMDVRSALGATLIAISMALFAIPGFSAGQAAVGDIMKFTTMVGVDGSFVGHNPIRGVIGDDLPWEIGSVKGSLTTDGHLQLIVRGLVFANVPSVPANLRGINDESQFRALVSCLSGDGTGKVATVNIKTGGFPATTSGDSNIDTFVGLPNQCVAPIIFVLSGSEDKWFSVTGFESE